MNKSIDGYDDGNDEDDGDDVITQLDGIDDFPLAAPLYSHPLFTGQPSSVRQPTPTLQPAIRRSSYTLKQKKQLSGLFNDTKISDYEITVSPVAHNVNIKCSTGFYTLVVLPSLSSITEQYAHSVDNINIKCSSIIGHIDDANSNVTASIAFSLSYKDGSSAGGVHMHLHHTTRRLQLQGSSLVHRKTRAPVWFVDHVIKGIFNLYASSKSVDISKFNSLVQQILTKLRNNLQSQDKCKACNFPFDGRSIPEVCPECNFKYHKKCVASPQHPCKTSFDNMNPSPAVLRVATSTPCPNPAISVSSFSPTIATTTLSSASERGVTFIIGGNTRVSQLSAPTSSSSLTPTKVSSPTTSSSNLTNVEAPSTIGETAINAIRSIDQVNHSSSHGTHFNLSAPPFQPQAAPFLHSDQPHPMPYTPPAQSGYVQHQTARSLSSSHHTQVLPPIPEQPSSRPKTTRKALKATPAIDRASFETECVRKQLNIAHTKIQELESELEKRKNTNHILGERIKLFEAANNKDIYEKYFPRDQSNASHSSAPSSSCHAHHCCAPPPCQTYRCHAPGKEPDLTSVVKELSIKVTQLSNDTATMKGEIRETIALAQQKVNHGPVIRASPNHVPLSPEIIVLDQEQFSQESSSMEVDQDQSNCSDSNTIDDNVTDEVPTNSLNCQAPTTQLHQLRHTPVSSQQ